MMTTRASWSFGLQPEPATIARAAVDWQLRMYGRKLGQAIEHAAPALGLTARKLRSILNGEPVRVLTTEYHSMLSRWWTEMDRQAAELHRRAKEMEDAAQAARHASQIAEAQLTLPFEE